MSPRNSRGRSVDENSDPKTAKKHPACIVPLYIALHCSAACLWIQCCPLLASAILIFLNIINSNFNSNFQAMRKAKQRSESHLTPPNFTSCSNEPISELLGQWTEHTEFATFESSPGTSGQRRQKKVPPIKNLSQNYFESKSLAKPAPLTPNNNDPQISSSLSWTQLCLMRRRRLPLIQSPNPTAAAAPVHTSSTRSVCFPGCGLTSQRRRLLKL